MPTPGTCMLQTVYEGVYVLDVLDALELTLAFTGEFLLVRCKLACSLVLERQETRPSQRPTCKLTRHKTKKKEGKAGVPFRMWKSHGCGSCDGGHGSAKGGVHVFN